MASSLTMPVMSIPATMGANRLGAAVPGRRRSLMVPRAGRPQEPAYNDARRRVMLAAAGGALAAIIQTQAISSAAVSSPASTDPRVGVQDIARVAAAEDWARPTVWEVLQNHGFPPGIIPDSVRDYNLERSTGSFEVLFSGGGDCKVGVAGYDLQYSSPVRGHLQTNKIDDLAGVKVRYPVTIFGVKLFSLPIGINGVSRDGDYLKFTAGPKSESAAYSAFARSPQCGATYN